MACLDRERDEKAFRIYLTDSVKILSDNFNGVYGGYKISKRYAEVLKPQKEETRTPEEIIESIRSRLKRMEGQP